MPLYCIVYTSLTNIVKLLYPLLLFIAIKCSYGYNNWYFISCELEKRAIGEILKFGRFYFEFTLI